MVFIFIMTITSYRIPVITKATGILLFQSTRPRVMRPKGTF